MRTSGCAIAAGAHAAAASANAISALAAVVLAGWNMRAPPGRDRPVRPIGRTVSRRANRARKRALTAADVAVGAPGQGVRPLALGQLTPGHEARVLRPRGGRHVEAGSRAVWGNREHVPPVGAEGGRDER